ncbi:hypothetical protein CPC08DRAFT_757722 [Agrocybe pediades]|nr:hypothetical protein CPC08DRAFT_757722 [Agrocybe pediades]
MGSIAWPIQLIADAHDNHGYDNKIIQLALADSFYSVLQIVTGQRSHPMMSIYHIWKSESSPHRHKGILQSAQDEFDKICRFNDMFDLDILPGDKSLTHSFISDLDIALRPFKDEAIRRDAGMIAGVLFGIVIIRVYLGRTAQDDLQIFWLCRSFTREEKHAMFSDESTELYEAKCGEVIRPKFPEELALLSCVEPVGKARHFKRSMSHVFAFTGMRTNPGRLNLIPFNDEKHILPPNVTAENEGGGMYEFLKSPDPGLTGGPPFVSSVTPPTNNWRSDALPEAPRARPKPIPKKKRQTSTVEVPVPDNPPYRIISMNPEAVLRTSAQESVHNLHSNSEDVVMSTGVADSQGNIINTGTALKRMAEEMGPRRSTRQKVRAS